MPFIPMHSPGHSVNLKSSIGMFIADLRNVGDVETSRDSLIMKAARIFHELLSRDQEDGRATWQPSRGTAGFRGVPEWYVAGADNRGRQEGRPYNSRSLRSAQSRKRVPSFVVAASNS